MVKEIITDEKLLSVKSEEVDIENMTPRSAIVEDLLETAMANKDRCLGLAANQIGVNKRLFAARKGDGTYVVFMNPKILARHDGVKKGVEHCLSRADKPGVRVRRSKGITLLYHVFDSDGKPIGIKSKFTGLAARTIQHELDHFEGKLI